jgi:hypothetical protein
MFALKAKYEYEVIVDPEQEDKSTEIILSKSGRPHMRAFHAAWISFFMAFVSWFSIAPILPTIKVDIPDAYPPLPLIRSSSTRSRMHINALPSLSIIKLICRPSH